MHIPLLPALAAERLGVAAWRAAAAAPPQGTLATYAALAELSEQNYALEELPAGCRPPWKRGNHMKAVFLRFGLVSPRLAYNLAALPQHQRDRLPFLTQLQALRSGQLCDPLMRFEFVGQMFGHVVAAGRPLSSMFVV